MTLPSEGINPWRAAPAPGGPGALPPKHSPAKLPDLKLGSDAAAKPADGSKEFKAFGDDGFTFWDLVDVVNPLQHIPLVSTLYRDLTDDTLDPAPRIMGGTLFLGPLGLAASVANVVVEHNTGKDMGSHVMAYFRDDAQPLATKTASAAPAAAGTDGTDGADPVTRWAAEQTAFYRAGQDTADPVSQWAAEQTAFYRGQDGTSVAAAAADTVGQWARAQHAYYQDAQPGTAATQVADAAPVAAGTDGVDVTAWAARQTAYYQGGEAAATSADDPVAAWARRQTAYYRAGGQTGQSPAVQNAEAPAAPVTNDVSTWARDQLAWVMGDRAKELASLPTTQPREHAARRDDDARNDPAASGAVADGGGWFGDNMVQGWTRYQAAQRLSEPGYRPDLDLAAGDR